MDPNYLLEWMHQHQELLIREVYSAARDVNAEEADLIQDQRLLDTGSTIVTLKFI